MINENSSIHEFNIQLICEYFSNVERQGPGSADTTIKALSFIDNLNDDSKIVDLGCGTGGQTITMAQNCKGQITAIDLFPDFIHILNKNAQNLNLQKRVKGVTGSMDNIPFANEELDLIWSEGAIYNIGFVRGLTEWRKYLKKGGYVAVTEASWFTDERPDEIHNFWTEAYPEIDTIPNKVAQMQQAGYVPVAAFIIPEYCWTKNFFEPQKRIQDAFLQKHKDNPAAGVFVGYMKHELELYNKYKDYYGYVFYIGRRLF